MDVVGVMMACFSVQQSAPIDINYFLPSRLVFKKSVMERQESVISLDVRIFFVGLEEMMENDFRC